MPRLWCCFLCQLQAGRGATGCAVALGCAVTLRSGVCHSTSTREGLCSALIWGRQCVAERLPCCPLPFRSRRRCWAQNQYDRPGFEEITRDLRCAAASCALRVYACTCLRQLAIGAALRSRCAQQVAWPLCLQVSSGQHRLNGRSVTVCGLLGPAQSHFNFGCHSHPAQMFST